MEVEMDDAFSIGRIILTLLRLGVNHSCNRMHIKSLTLWLHFTDLTDLDRPAGKNVHTPTGHCVCCCMVNVQVFSPLTILS